MTQEKLKGYFDLYTDTWRFFRKYSEPNDSDDFWEAMISESREIYGKHNQSEIAKNLLVETINEIERIWKEQKNTNQEKNA